VDLHAIPPDQVAAELFGVKAGTFTQVRERAGRVAEAEGGTLFLDELDSLSSEAQTALLTLVDEKRYRRLGEDQDRHADVRVIASGLPRLKTMMEQGSFRSDLYFRLSTLPVELPPLRERPSEIQGFAQKILEANPPEGGGRVQITAEAEALLLTLPWPGNLRELRQVLTRACLLSERRGPVLEVTAEALRDALSLDLLSQAPPPRGLLARYRDAALALRDLLPRLAQAGIEPKRACEAIYGMLLAVVLEAETSPDAMAARLGFGERKVGGNHLNTLRTYAGRVAELCALTGEPIPPALTPWRSDDDASQKRGSRHSSP